MLQVIRDRSELGEPGLTCLPSRNLDEGWSRCLACHAIVLTSASRDRRTKMEAFAAAEDLRKYLCHDVGIGRVPNSWQLYGGRDRKTPETPNH
jgi:hypothetical protein